MGKSLLKAITGIFSGARTAPTPPIRQGHKFLGLLGKGGISAVAGLVFALVPLGRGGEAAALLQDIAETGRGAGYAHARRGDLSLQEERFEDAVRAFEQALELDGSYSSTEGFVQDGLAYVAERMRFQMRGDEGISTANLLAIDPLTHRIVHRYLLPGTPTSFVVEGERIEIRYQPMNSPPASIGFSHGGFDRRVAYRRSGSLLARLDDMRAGWLLAENFVQDLDTNSYPAAFTLHDNNDALPMSFDELRDALVAARKRDPMQPWHTFFLAQTYVASGDPEAADQAFEQLLAGDYPATPYLQFGWMAAFCIRLQQPLWAERLYDEALERRRSDPEPIEVAHLIEQLVNAPFARAAGHVLREGGDPEWAHAWVRRLRQLSGAGFEVDPFAAVAWREYFRERGNDAAADAEDAYLGRIQQSRATAYVAQLAYFDYSLYFLICVWIGALALLIPFLGALRVEIPREEPSRHRLGSVALDAGTTQAIILGARFVTAGLFVFFCAVIYIRIVFDRATRPTELVAYAALLTALLAATFSHLLPGRFRFPRSDVLTITFPPRSRFSPRETPTPWAAVFAVCLLVAGLSISGVAADRMGAWDEFPLSSMYLMDGFGAVAPTPELLHWFGEPRTDQAHYVLGWLYHSAGEHDDAAEHYRSISEASVEVAANLEAALEGSAPVSSISASEFFEARHSRSGRGRVEELFGYASGFRSTVVWPDIAHLPVTGSRLTILVLLLLLLLLALRGGRARGGASRPSPVAGPFGLAGRVTLVLAPGVYDTMRGAWLRGFLTAAASALAVVGGTYGWGVFRLPARGIGWLTWSVMSVQLQNAYPLPPGHRFEEVSMLHYLDAIPFASTFVAIVMLATVAAIFLHGTAVRRLLAGR